MAERKILVIVPAFNECGNIQRTVEEVFRQRQDVDVVVIDDGSSDLTVQEARQTTAAVISLPFNLGIGGAVQTGFQFAHSRGYEFAIQVDGDGQHDPQFISAILEPLVSGQSDIVVGSRFVPPFLGYQSSFVRRIGIHFFARLIRGLTGYHITDPTSGFRAFNRKAIQAFAEEYPQDFPEPESIVIAKRWGMRVTEVPVSMRKRFSGLSSIRYLRTLYYMLKVTFAILLDMLKQRSAHR